MIVVGWMRLRRFFRSTLTWQSRLHTHSRRRVKTIPGFEPLESMALLSTGIHMISSAAAHVDHSSNRRPLYHVTDPRVLYTDVMTSAQPPT